MADYTERIILDDSEFVKPIKGMIDEAEKLGKTITDSQKQVSDATKKAGADVVKSEKEVKQAVAETSAEIGKQNKSIIENINTFKVFGTSIKDVQDKVTGYIGRLKEVRENLISNTAVTEKQSNIVSKLSNAFGFGQTALTGLIKGLNVFKVAVASTGIGALLLAFSAIQSFLKNTETGMDLVANATSYMGAAFDVAKGKLAGFGGAILESIEAGTFFSDAWNVIVENVKTRFDGLLKLGGAIKTLFTKGFKEAANEVTDATLQIATGFKADDIKGFVSEMNEAGKAAVRLAEDFRALANAERDFKVEVAKMKAELASQKEIAADSTKTFFERTQALRRAAEIEREQLTKSIGLLEHRAQLEKQKYDNLPDNLKTADAYQKVLDLEIAIHEKRAENSIAMRRLTKELNSLIDQQKKKLDGITESMIELGIWLNDLSKRDEFEVVKQKQIDNLKEMKAALMDIGKTLGIDVTPKVESLDNAIENLSNTFYTEIVTPLESRPLTPILSIKPKLSVDVGGPEPKEIVDNVFDAEFVNDFETLLKETFDELFDGSIQLNPDKLREFNAGAKELLFGFANILNEATALQITNIDKQLNKLSEKRSELEDSLNYELELQKEGLANNVADKQKEVDAILAEEARLNAEREKLQQEAQRRQIIVDSVQQGSSLVSSAANIIKGFSNIPIVGLPLGIAAVATMFGFFAKTKLDALKATKLHTGAERISDHFGFGNVHGATDLPGKGDGYRLVDERSGKRTNVIISGREYLLPERESMQHRNFLDNLKNGLYNGIDLHSAIMSSVSHKDKLHSNQTATVNNNIINVPKQPIRQYVTFEKNGKTKAVLVTIDDKTADGSIINLN